MRKVRLPGTHRAVRPETTWTWVEPRLRHFGITRVADITRLDNIGIPVFLAVRPASETLAVSQGKGASPLLARLSAVMESIELWHAERPMLPTFVAKPTGLGLPYAMTDLNLRARDSWVLQLELPWVQARSLVDDRHIPVPLDLVRLSYSGKHFWRSRLFESSSTGLASGNTPTEACLHGLYEAVERDALAAHPSRSDAGRLRIAPETIRDDHLRSLMNRLTDADVEFDISCIPNRFGIPTFAAFVWSPLFPIVCAGSGAHMDPVVALSRALTEAVQSRLTEISATRDDIPSTQDTWRDASTDPGFPTTPGASIEEVLRGHRADFDDMEEELAEVTRRVMDVTGHAPMAVPLSDPSEPFSVVRVICPALAYAEGRTLSA
ncbi:YcaO-like family protein [Streptomyces erythrochromogenes]|uniref:YcaO-like family protein n=1 Tax=Streptomyces erythrochromogenes TaxID=285574 RepID=UPI0036B294EA